MSKQICFKLPSINDCEIIITPCEEYISPYNEFEDIELIKEIINKACDNIWAWCTIKLEVYFKGLKGVDYLGCCSYDSEKEFKENSGYYDDMVKNAYNDLIKQLESFSF